MEKPYIPTVAENWIIFSDVIPADAPQEYVRHMKRAFYCGFRLALEAMDCIDQNTDTIQRFDLEMALIKQECDAFARLIQQEKA